MSKRESVVIAELDSGDQVVEAIPDEIRVRAEAHFASSPDAVLIAVVKCCQCGRSARAEVFRSIDQARDWVLSMLQSDDWTVADMAMSTIGRPELNDEVMPIGMKAN